MESKSQLEARVLGYVDQIRAGCRVEDDLVECKRTWPEIGKAKQIAGLANKANGEPFLIIVGIDERTSQIVPLGDVDPADWWSRIRGKFDQDVWPDLAWHIGVVVNEAGEQVVALLFTSDRAPYVVKTEGGGSPEREIPIRDGTTTRSATRRELLRLLAPAARIPSITIISAMTECFLHAERSRSEVNSIYQPEEVEIWARLGVYIEHTATDQVTVIPEHRIRAELRFEGYWVANLETAIIQDDSERISSRSPWGVWAEKRQIICSASGPASLHARGRFSPSTQEYVESSEPLLLRVYVGVAGTEMAILAEANLRPYAVEDRPLIPGRKMLGSWGFDIGNLELLDSSPFNGSSNL